MRQDTWLCGMVLGLVVSAGAWGQQAKLNVKVDQPGVRVSPTLYGIFFEEINRAGEGGLYGEMLLNRSFEDMSVPAGWTMVAGGGAQCIVTLDRSRSLNANNPTCLKLEITRVPADGRAGIANEGYKGRGGRPRGGSPEAGRDFLTGFERAAKAMTSGLMIEQGKEYRLSLYARCETGFSGPLTASIEKQDGTVLAKQNISDIGVEWKKFECVLTVSASDTNAKLVVAATKPGTLYLDMVSLFPKETFKNRPNGLRRDLAQLIANMRPAFVRFPGGCYVEGDSLPNAFRWKKTIGDVAERPGHWNLWGYYSSDGLGYHEYLQFCEDIGAEPLFVINCGMSHVEQRADDRRQKVEVPDWDSYVQDALDAIEYANGPIDSKWGSLRAKAGHPAPFNLKYMEIGNENGGPLYNQRYALFYDAIKAKYPQMKLIANDWRGIPNSRKVEMVDEHYYNNPDFFMARANMYDRYDRARYQVYVGEYAVTQGCGQGNLIAALGEAAYMTGLERNGDVVVMASYAPLLVYPAWKAWNPNAIVFDAARAYGTPSYHVQAMFANHRADTVLPLTLDSPQSLPRSKRGMVGVATWSTQAEFKDVRVVGKDGTVLLRSGFSTDMAGWRTRGGTWEVKDGTLRQTGGGEGVRALAGDPSWADYTLTLKARKLGGAEGFLVLFQNANSDEKHWWNIGGWGNSRHALECGGVPDQSVNGSIETGRWYDIKVELNGPSIKCYLDGKLVHDVTRGGSKSLFGVAGLNADRSEMILKVVNTGETPIPTALTLEGVGQVEPIARTIVLAGKSTEDENSFEQPKTVVPIESTISGVSGSFNHTFPAYSVTVMRVRLKR
ncbi:MAG: alpha-L-arabinofuranosidase C-terminal domain-containing protein [Bacillota bacterium]